MDLLSLLSAMSDGEFHSGSELGERLGVSRTAIWKALDHLSALGLRYESHRGKGYRLLRPLDLISDDVVMREVSPSISPLLSLQCVESCGSTNVEIHNRFPELPTKFVALLSELQTQGRGRRGKVWQSPFAQNIYLSLVFDWLKGVGELQGLSIVVGVAVADLLSDLNVPDVGLKWPNDVWVGRKKLAGILVELQGEANGAWRVTLGLGLNVSMDDEAAQEIDQPWTALSSYSAISRSELAGRLVDGICRELKRFEAQGFAPYVERFAKYDALIEKEVRLLGPDVVGTVKGVGTDGALLMESDGLLESYHAGEISVRLM